MTETEMKRRTKSFALRVLALIDALPEKRSARVLAHQVGRSGTSVGANYRAACRAKSAADMINKLTIVEEEADETGFWLELIEEHGLMKPEKLSGLKTEAGELTAMMVASRKTLLRNNRKSKFEIRKSP